MVSASEAEAERKLKPEGVILPSCLEFAASRCDLKASVERTDKLTNRQPLLHAFYLAAILIKGFFGLLEFTGGAVIAIFGPQRLYGFVLRIIDPELYEGGHIRTAELVLKGAAALAQSPVHFVIFYLFVHGTLKMAITAVLLRGHGAWIFPTASVIILSFLGFFAYDLSHHWSNWVLGLALFDTATLLLVLNEWRNWKKG